MIVTVRSFHQKKEVLRTLDKPISAEYTMAEKRIHQQMLVCVLCSDIPFRIWKIIKGVWGCVSISTCVPCGAPSDKFHKAIISGFLRWCHKFTSRCK